MEASAKNAKNVVQAFTQMAEALQPDEPNHPCSPECPCKHSRAASDELFRSKRITLSTAADETSKPGNETKKRRRKRK
jgi:hypothetical protein